MGIQFICGLGKRKKGAREILGEENRRDHPVRPRPQPLPLGALPFNLPSASLSEESTKNGPLHLSAVTSSCNGLSPLLLVIYQDQGEISPGL